MTAGAAPAAGKLIDDLGRLSDEFQVEIRDLSTEQEIRLAQARYLGRKGRVTDLMKALGRIPAEERPRVGEAANRARDLIENAVTVRLRGLQEQALAAELARVEDVTLPPRGDLPGTLHPLTLVRRQVETIFLELGFEVRTGPWVETEWNNFDALNTPPEHPARDMQDTFFVEGGLVLRSHTSPVQVRTMLAGPPPVKIIAPGNVFRRDDDATHTPMFPQVEGLHVDKGVSFEDLEGHAGLLRAAVLRPRHADPPAPQLLPVHRAVGRGGRLLLEVRGQAAGPHRPAGCARAPAGWRSAAAAWSTPTCSRRSATTSTTSPASPSGWGCRAWRCSSTR